jgi:hypothetical protein
MRDSSRPVNSPALDLPPGDCSAALLDTSSITARLLAFGHLQKGRSVRQGEEKG